MPTPGAVNITTEFYERPYAAYHEQSDTPSWFRHVAATYTGPTVITFPGTLNSLERAEVNAWLGANDCQRPAMLAKCRHRAAIAKITEYIAYYADVTYLAWRDTEAGTRMAQWRLFVADALIASKTTQAASSDSGGIGSASPTPPFAQATNLT